jgi:hypothetical protein
VKSERNDIRGIGTVMLELMEPTTYILDPDSTELKDADRWKDGLGIEDFWKATWHKPL